MPSQILRQFLRPEPRPAISTVPHNLLSIWWSFLTFNVILPKPSPSYSDRPCFGATNFWWPCPPTPTPPTRGSCTTSRRPGSSCSSTPSSWRWPPRPRSSSTSGSPSTGSRSATSTGWSKSTVHNGYCVLLIVNLFEAQCDWHMSPNLLHSVEFGTDTSLHPNLLHLVEFGTGT